MKPGIFHPFGRMPRYIVATRSTSGWRPFTHRRADIKWWVIFGGRDRRVDRDRQVDRQTAAEHQRPAAARDVHLEYRRGLHTGAAQRRLSISSGRAAKSDHFRETGLLGFETLIDTTIVETVIKAATHRARPLESDGKGHFWDARAAS